MQHFNASFFRLIPVNKRQIQQHSVYFELEDFKTLCAQSGTGNRERLIKGCRQYFMLIIDCSSVRFLFDSKEIPHIYNTSFHWETFYFYLPPKKKVSTSPYNPYLTILNSI